jgi:hypothetical protein
VWKILNCERSELSVAIFFGAQRRKMRFKDITNNNHIMTSYYLIDKSKLFSIISTSTNLNDVLHQFLSQIDDALHLFLHSEIQVPLEKLNYDYLYCLEIVPSNKPHPFITNIYKFNIINMHFYDIHNNVISLSVPHFKLICDGIKSKLDHLCPQKKQTKQQTSTNTIEPTQPRIIRQMGSKITEKSLEPKNIIIQDKDDDSEDAEDVDLLDPEMIKKTISALKELKDAEQKELEGLQKNNDENIKKFSDHIDKLNDIKRDLTKNKEIEIERRNKFEANKKAFFKIRQDIKEGKFSEDKISELFINEYPIYKFMDQMNMLNKPDDYIVYLSLYNELYEINTDKKHSDYVPHNVNYLSEDDKQKYVKLKEQNKDLIEEFMNGKKTNKKYPSIEEILKSVDEDDCTKNKSEENDFVNVSFN